MSAAAAESTSAPSAPAPVFHSKRTAALVPKDAHPRSKKAIRDAIHNFSEQFVRSLVARLVDYCNMRRSKTVDLKTLAIAANDLLGDGASELPAGVASDALPQTLIFSRFKRNLKGLRTEGGSDKLVTIIGFNFLRYVQEILLTVYTDETDPKTVDADAVIRALSTSRGYSRSGLPCIAYRPEEVASTATNTQSAATASSSPRTKKTPKVAAAAAPAVATPAPAAAAVATPAAPAAATVSRKKKAAPEEAGAVVDVPAAAPPKKNKKKNAPEAVEAATTTVAASTTAPPKKKARSAAASSKPAE